ncbi:MAG: tRNA threonylcarbamoyladenosine dehydratase [Bacteroidales bacterium]|nr:tRNA threonylcarbamoyladenosine dehydratase [Bacteroidales bacterium]MCM1148314.1 tRNA threonylcarbamoyladenosine dehydratase [Bacteroidales bacterium]MCM1206518.1 tRNA threonylcarbamoyladenosine dehydratase [Bacillota bacterium]MCM1510405.1 tRNA threonylcarbamoyladenosine dehydratase [Clostridium sp.]
MEIQEKEIYHRTERLLGPEAMERIRTARVIIFGIGGVGSWCAESLVRSGISRLTIADPDSIAATNINRQLMATTKTVGRPKVEALKEHLLDICPSAEITTLQTAYSKETKDSFHLENYDYIIDCIDSLKDKIQLILHATATKHNNDGNADTRPVFFSSMGAALRMDPLKVRVTEFWKVKNDTLGALLRKRMRQKKLLPERKFLCVYSEELPMENQGLTDETCDYKAVINGSLHHVTGIFGFTLAGLVISDIKAKAGI